MGEKQVNISSMRRALLRKHRLVAQERVGKKMMALHRVCHPLKKGETSKKRFLRILKQEMSKMRMRGNNPKHSQIVFIEDFNGIDSVIKAFPKNDRRRKILQKQKMNSSQNISDNENCFAFSNEHRVFVLVGGKASNNEIRRVVRVVLDPLYEQIDYSESLAAWSGETERFKEFNKFMAKHYGRATKKDWRYINSAEGWRKLSVKFDRIARQEAMNVKPKKVIK